MIDRRKAEKLVTEQILSTQTSTNTVTLELSDIQATVLRSRPSPYRGEYVGLRIDDAAQGREMLLRLIPHIAPADAWWTPSLPAWLGIAFTYEGLKALGLPQASLDSFPPEFREGMAARAAILNDMGENAPTHWEHPFGTADLHVALAIYSSDDQSLETVLEQARVALHELPQICVVYRLRFHELPGGRNPFGFRDGLHNPEVEGSGSTASPGYGRAIKAGEFVMGYPDELGETATSPEPETLRRNGTFVAFRKLQTRVGDFRKYLREQSSSAEEEQFLAAKMFGRWPSGAPLVLAPEKDDAVLGEDASRNDVFRYQDDMVGLKCPFSAHIRRVNPRDALAGEFVAVDLHHFLRRGTNYGPPLPDGVMEDDGIDRGGVFLLIGTHLTQQFEFVQSQWITDGNFINQGTEQDPIIGNDRADKLFTIPHHPIRRRLHGLPQFVALCGGEYFFMPGLQALTWMANQTATTPLCLNIPDKHRSLPITSDSRQHRRKTMTEPTAAATATRASPAGMKDQGLQMGQAHEFLILLPLKQGGAAKMKEKAKTFGDNIKSIDKIATVHDFRYAIFDNDTRLLFASTYDGGFEQYIKDFSTLIPDQIDTFFEECEGYPGVRHPEIWAYIARYQLQALVFYSAYPDVPVREVWKGQRVLKAFDVLLDLAQS